MLLKFAIAVKGQSLSPLESEQGNILAKADCPNMSASVLCSCLLLFFSILRDPCRAQQMDNEFTSNLSTSTLPVNESDPFLFDLIGSLSLNSTAAPETTTAPATTTSLPESTTTDTSSTSKSVHNADLYRCNNLTEVYTNCSNSCPASCEEPNRKPCRSYCWNGCECAPGFVKDYRWRCIPVADCPSEWFDLLNVEPTLFLSLRMSKQRALPQLWHQL